MTLHMRGIGLALILVASAACARVEPEGDAPPASPASPPSAAADEWAAYRAGGNEPFWTVTIGKATIDFADMGVDMKASSPRVAPTTLPDGWRFSGTSGGRPLVVEIRNTRCSDSMSGMPFPHTVTVAVADRTYSGCGGKTIDLLTAGEWRVVQLDSVPTSAARQPTMTFASDSSVSGSGGCNRYRATWKLTGEGIDFGPAMATKMACAEGNLNQQESHFFSLLDQVTRFDIDSRGELVLYVNDRVAITARRTLP